MLSQWEKFFENCTYHFFKQFYFSFRWASCLFGNWFFRRSTLLLWTCLVECFYLNDFGFFYALFPLVEALVFDLDLVIWFAFNPFHATDYFYTPWNIRKSHVFKGYKKRSVAWNGLINFSGFNPLSANPTKWSNTLKQFVGKSRRIVWLYLTTSLGLALTGLMSLFHSSPPPLPRTENLCRTLTEDMKLVWLISKIFNSVLT